jgi:hypothetical protein
MFEAVVLQYIRCCGNLLAVSTRPEGFASTEHAWYSAFGDCAFCDTRRQQDCSIEPTSYGME